MFFVSNQIARARLAPGRQRFEYRETRNKKAAHMINPRCREEAVLFAVLP